MSKQMGRHCGHDCCDEPQNPFHGHFLEPEDCQLCVRARFELQALQRRIDEYKTQDPEDV